MKRGMGLAMAAGLALGVVGAGCATTAESERVTLVASLGTPTLAARHSRLSVSVRGCAQRDPGECERVSDLLASRSDNAGVPPRALSQALLSVAHDGTGAIYSPLPGGMTLVSSVRRCGGGDDSECDRLADVLEGLASAGPPGGNVTANTLANTIYRLTDERHAPLSALYLRP